jgi:hypothetical protein
VVESGYRSLLSKHLLDLAGEPVQLPGRRERDCPRAIEDRETTAGEIRLQQLADCVKENHFRYAVTPPSSMVKPDPSVVRRGRG